jgi:hypothetical protein
MLHLNDLAIAFSKLSLCVAEYKLHFVFHRMEICLTTKDVWSSILGSFLCQAYHNVCGVQVKVLVDSKGTVFDVAFSSL